MYATVIELDALTDTVGAATQDHDLPLIGHRIVIGRIVSGIEIGAVLGAAYMNAVPCFHHADLFPGVTDIVFGNFQNLAKVFVGEAVLLRLGQRFGSGHFALMLHQGFFFLHQFLHLLDKVFLHCRNGIDLFYRSALAQGFVHLEVAFGRRCAQ